MKAPLRVLAVLGAAFVSEAALARDFRVREIPNGEHFRCQNCHVDNSGQSFTSFGSDSKSHLVQGDGSVSTEHVLWDDDWCNRDSDNDGKTNGEELGDPGCTWVAGDSNPAGMVTNPGAAGDGSGCGNGAVDPGESCDGMKTHAFSCAELNLGKGLLGCTADCAYDTAKCTGGPPPGLPWTPEGEGCSTASGTGASALALAALALLVASRKRK